MKSIIYEINTRVWIKQFTKNNVVPKIIDVHAEYWEALANKGIKYVWLMGIWETVPETIEKYCFADGLINEYNMALNDWKNDDVVGSPYAIDDYKINSTFATHDEFIKFKEKLNNLGLKIILDFIPNHFHAETSLLKTNPDIFLQGNEELYSKDKATYFKSSTGNIYAHGRDPNFSAWEDTIQVNYFSESAREFMISTLVNLTQLCDGIRCDMAMLPINNIFQKTWNENLAQLGVDAMENEFWNEAIPLSKKANNDFLFIAEAYWDLEWQLQQFGFDYTYDKKLLDCLEYGKTECLYEHLKADKSYQQKSIRFIENHDEKRAITSLGLEKSKAAAIAISTMEGATLFHDGQFEGRKIKLPVQLGREPNEDINNSLVQFYDNLLQIVKHPIFSDGQWSLITPTQLPNDTTNKFLLSWQWALNEDKRIVIINFSNSPAYCLIKFYVNIKNGKVTLVDLLNSKEFKRDVKEIVEEGLFIHLEAYQSHIFKIK